MSINWGEMWNRYNFFSTTRSHYEQDLNSITEPIDNRDKTEYDINFQQAIDGMGDEGQATAGFELP